MLKKHRIIALLVLVLLSFSTVVQATESFIDKSQINSGIIKVNNNGKVGAVRVTKGNEKVDHIVKGNDNIPLNLGNGEYTIQVLESVGGKSYKQIGKEIVSLKMEDLNSIYLLSIEMINWNKDMNGIKEAKELTKNSKTDKEKVEAIYKYIVSNISYDYDKAIEVSKPSNVNLGYKPNIDEVLKAQKGICYDYSSLMGGMLRSLGIPTKLVMGYKSDIKEYHAWNQVYLQDTNEWVTIDTTYDAAMKKGNAKVTMIKDASEYKIAKEY